jgi:bifunctional non-homologous end joining protein LigD
MRQPIFMGLREDKDPKDVRKEEPMQAGKQSGEPPAKEAGQPKLLGVRNKRKEDAVELSIGGRKVRVSHPSKVYWPDDGLTKLDLVEYYLAVAPVMLPYLRDRPESMHRHPNGIIKESFFQKDVIEETLPKWIETFDVTSDSEERTINYLVCNEPATLAYMANLGCIEINPWNSRTVSPEHPDYLVIDLDPLDIEFEAVVEAALATKKVFEKLGIESFCKTSGATGLHIYVPLDAAYTYDEARTFSEIIARLVHAELPKTTSVERSPAKRKGKIYIDFLQNRRGQTLAAPYSVRPRPGAPVSTPLIWSEVNAKLNPVAFTIRTTLARLKKTGDLWKPVLGPGIDMKAVLKNTGMQELNKTSESS